MFQIGDKVVCIDPYVIKGKQYKYLLEKYKIYIVIDVNYGFLCNEIKVNNSEGHFFDVNRFISLVDLRKDKILKLKQLLCQS